MHQESTKVYNSIDILRGSNREGRRVRRRRRRRKNTHLRSERPEPKQNVDITDIAVECRSHAPGNTSHRRLKLTDEN